MNARFKAFSTLLEAPHEKEEYDVYGLGLSIVKNIIQRHGGRVWIESEPNIRTVVCFSLSIT